MTEQVRQALELLYHLQGRKDDVRELLIESLNSTDQNASHTAAVYLLDHSAFPVDYVRKSLEAADPNDDRVWLGQANLAAWSGQLDEAARLLAKCASRRPDDVAGLARLDVAQSAGDVLAFRQAAAHLPLSRFPDVEMLKLRAWLAARQSDAAVERSILGTLVGVAPGTISAWDRLAELALKAGRAAEAQDFNKQTAAFNRIREEYKVLLDRDDRAQHSRELADLAGRLGRSIEARDGRPSLEVVCRASRWSPWRRAQRSTPCPEASDSTRRLPI